LIAKEPLLISSSSSPASAPNARVLETADSARRGPSFPTRAVSAVADAEEIWSAADDPSNSSDKTCKHTTHVNRGSCKGREHGHSAQHPRYSPYILHCAHAAQFLDDFQALTDTRDTAAASSNFSPRSATPCAMSALTRLAPAITDSEGGPASCGEGLNRRVHPLAATTQRAHTKGDEW